MTKDDLFFKMMHKFYQSRSDGIEMKSCRVYLDKVSFQKLINDCGDDEILTHDNDAYKFYRYPIYMIMTKHSLCDIVINYD